MAKKKSKLVRVQLSGDPYESALFCPYCGTKILEPGAEDMGECPHLILAEMDEDPEESGEETFGPGDVCFVFNEAAPASREHYFVFRAAAED